MNDAAPSIQVYLNGDPRTVPAGLSLADLVTALGIPPQAALVEHNGQALMRSQWPETRLAEVDRLEILRVVAGG